MDEGYEREDIYYCPDCGYFFDIETDKVVDIPYSEMPGVFAIEAMKARENNFTPCHSGQPSKRKRAKKPKGNGFSI